MRRGNVAQAILHVATTGSRPTSRAGPATGTGSRAAWHEGPPITSTTSTSAGRRPRLGCFPDPLPLYAFTISALDDTLAPPGHHTVYLACPAAPAVVRGGWDRHRTEFVDRALDAFERRAPGFRDSIVGVATWAPDEMMAAERWPGAHPMHVDIPSTSSGSFDQSPAWPAIAPVDGLYVAGAGAGPAGGIAGTPGRQAPRTLLCDRRAQRRRTPTLTVW